MLPRIIDYKEVNEPPRRHGRRSQSALEHNADNTDKIQWQPTEGKSRDMPLLAQLKVCDDIRVRYEKRGNHTPLSDNVVQGALVPPYYCASAEERRQYHTSCAAIVSRPHYIKPLDPTVDLSQGLSAKKGRPGPKERSEQHIQGLGRIKIDDEDYRFANEEDDIEDSDSEDDDKAAREEKARELCQFSLILPLDENKKQLLFANDFTVDRIKDLMGSDEDATTKLRETVWPMYDDLRLLFNFFALDTANLKHGKVTLELWQKFCQACKIRDKKVTENAVTRVFDRVLIEAVDAMKAPKKKKRKKKKKGPPPQPPAAFDRSLFIDALIRLSFVKFPNKAKPHERLKSLFTNHLEPFGLLVAPDPEDFRPALLWHRPRAVLNAHLGALRVRFNDYAEASMNDDGARGEVEMSLTRFNSFLKDYDLYDSDLTIFRAMKAFACSLNENDLTTDTLPWDTGLSLGGFMEALTRIAAFKYRALPLSQAMEELFNICLGRVIARGVRASGIKTTDKRMMPESEKHYEITSSTRNGRL